MNATESIVRLGNIFDGNPLPLTLHTVLLQPHTVACLLASFSAFHLLCYLPPSGWESEWRWREKQETLATVGSTAPCCLLNTPLTTEGWDLFTITHFSLALCVCVLPLVVQIYIVGNLLAHTYFCWGSLITRKLECFCVWLPRDNS